MLNSWEINNRKIDFMKKIADHDILQWSKLLLELFRNKNIIIKHFSIQKIRNHAMLLTSDVYVEQRSSNGIRYQPVCIYRKL